MTDLLHATLIGLKWSGSWYRSSDWRRPTVWEDGLRICSGLRRWLLHCPLVLRIHVHVLRQAAAESSNSQPLVQVPGSDNAFGGLKRANVTLEDNKRRSFTSDSDDERR